MNPSLSLSIGSKNDIRSSNHLWPEAWGVAAGLLLSLANNKVNTANQDPSIFYIYFIYNYYLFNWLCQVLRAAHGIFSCHVWDLAPWPGIETGSPGLGACNLNHWSTREVPGPLYLKRCGPQKGNDHNSSLNCHPQVWGIVRIFQPFPSLSVIHEKS